MRCRRLGRKRACIPHSWRAFALGSLAQPGKYGKHEIRSLHYQHQQRTRRIFYNTTNARQHKQPRYQSRRCRTFDFAVAMEPSNRPPSSRIHLRGPLKILLTGPATARSDQRTNRQSIMALHSPFHMQETARPLCCCKLRPDSPRL
jgi:hypothetical protein